MHVLWARCKLRDLILVIYTRVLRKTYNKTKIKRIFTYNCFNNNKLNRLNYIFNE